MIEASVLLTSEAEREAWLTAPVEEALKLQRSLPNEALRVVATGESKTRSQHSLLTGSRFGAGAESDPLRGAFRKRMGANHCPQTFTTQLSYWRIESPLLATDSSAYRGGRMLEKRTSGVGESGSPRIDFVSITQGLLVVECLSFRRAAKVLGIRQSTVSRRVRSLEDRLGVSLFERFSGGVRVTAAGARFFDRARYALLQLDHAIKAAGAAGRGENGVLRIGIVSSVAAGFLRELIRAYGERYPDVGVQISEGGLREHTALICKGRVDVAFVMGTPVVPNCEIAQFWTERLFVALPQGHILCGKKEIDWEALRNERFIVRQSDAGLAIQDHVIKRLADLGHHPSVQRLEVGRDTLVHLVALGLGISLTSEATTATLFPEVVFRPIAGASEVFPFSGVWSPSNDNPALRRFLSLARVLAQKQKQHAGSGSAQVSFGSIIDSINLSLAFLVAHAQRLDLLT